MDFLSEIIARKTSEIISKKTSLRIDDMLPRRGAEPRDFVGSIKTGGFALIAEIKRMSPSAGIIVQEQDPARLARAYGSSGARAVSVLTDSGFFGGDDGHIEIVKKACRLPVLRKDFIIDEYQIHESLYLGADAILLIARLLDHGDLGNLMNLAEKLGMASLVEVHNDEDLAKAVEAGATVIGVNNRDLKTFNVDVDVSLKLIGSIPDSCTAISESGIRSYEDVRRLSDAGFDGILVGTALIQAPDVIRKIRELRGLGKKVDHGRA